MVKSFKVATFDTGPTLITKVCIVFYNVMAFRPDALGAQFLRSAEGEAIAGAAVTDGMQSTLTPLAIGSVHQTLFVSLAE